MTRKEPATAVGADAKDTEVGSVFVSNYPPYSFWGEEALGRIRAIVEARPDPDTPLGLYLHIPFCRKRCKFCYFRVFIEKTGAEVQRYMDALYREIELFAAKPIVGGRRPRFVYFGGGTPSFISAKHLRQLVQRLRSSFDLDGVEEFAFECEPGTLTRPKLETIREIGVTRLSLGVENFDDRILEENGRAHVSKEIYRVLPWIREIGFDQVNIDLIAGMVGETFDTWRINVDKAIEIGPDSITVYQMELPFNTVYSKRILEGGGVPVADWATKREWHAYAFERFAAAGYERSSAYTMARRGGKSDFVYRNSVWQGCDLLSLGVSSFGHLGGVHYQNATGWLPYLEQVESGVLPFHRALAPTHDERLTREWILQLKLGHVEVAYFENKFHVDVRERFAGAIGRLAERGMLAIHNGSIRLTDEGLLRVDSLLPEFYDERYQNTRYT